MSLVAAGDDGAGVRAVRDAARVKRDRGLLDAFAAGKMAPNIEEHFVRLDVGMCPGNADGFRMRVQHPGSKSADDKPRSIESLMDRRRLVERAGDRLEVVGIKRVRVKHAVPTDHVERMMGEGVASQTPAVLDENRRVFFAVDDLRLAGSVEVAFAVGRPEADLAVGLVVSLWDDHAYRRLKDEEIG